MSRVKVFYASDSPFVPSSHEDPHNPGVLKKVMFGREDFQLGAIAMVNWAFMKAGDSFRPHYHTDMDEVFVVVSGKLEFLVDRVKYSVGRGDGIIIRDNTVHEATAISDTDVTYIVFGVAKGKSGRTVVV